MTRTTTTTITPSSTETFLEVTTICRRITMTRRRTTTTPTKRMTSTFHISPAAVSTTSTRRGTTTTEQDPVPETDISDIGALNGLTDGILLWPGLPEAKRFHSLLVEVKVLLLGVEVLLETAPVIRLHLRRTEQHATWRTSQQH